MKKIRNRRAARNLKPGTWVTRPGSGDTIVIVSRYDSHHDWYTCHEVDWTDDGDGVETDRAVYLTSADFIGATVDSEIIKTDSTVGDIDRDYEIIAHADRSLPNVKWLDEGWLVRYNGDLFFVETDADITDIDWCDWSSIENKFIPDEIDAADEYTYYHHQTSKEVIL